MICWICWLVDPSIPAWRIPWTKELGGLQSMGSQKVGCDWATYIYRLQFRTKCGFVQIYLIVSPQWNMTDSVCLELSHRLALICMLTKKDAQCESCELSFIWGKMKTAAQETAPQIALRDGSREIVAQGQYIWLCWRGISVQSSTYLTEGFLLIRRSCCHHERI